MSKLNNFFTGMVKFKVMGLSVSCINKLRQFNATRISVDGDTICFSVPLVYADNVKKLVSNFEFSYTENFNIFRGLNFLLARMTLSISIIFFIISFFVFDMAIYDIKVVGANADLQSNIKAYLSDLDINKFSLKSKLDDPNIAYGLVNEFSEIAHANLRVSGNTLVVSVSEAVDAIEKITLNVYAQYDAVIKDIILFSGKALVEVGDVVRKGDLLIENAYQGTVAVTGEVAYLYQDKVVRLDISII